MAALLTDLEGIMYNFDLDFDLENPVFKIPIIPLPCVSRPMIYHYGSEAGYQRFRYSYFMKNDTEYDDNFIYKHIICDIKYQPDELYSYHDGMTGKCWIVTIDDNENCKRIKYYIRNWIDIVEYFKEKNLKFVMEF